MAKAKRERTQFWLSGNCILLAASGNGLKGWGSNAKCRRMSHRMSKKEFWASLRPDLSCSRWPRDMADIKTLA